MAKPTNAVEEEKSTAGFIWIKDGVLEMEENFSKTNKDTYNSQLQDGLRIRDLRGILGIPPQFLPTADPRIDADAGCGDNYSFGRVYSEKIIKNIPLLLIIPGMPHFMSTFSNGDKRNVLGAMFGQKNAGFDNVMDSGGGKFYSLKFAYVEYFNFVNTMLRSAAVFLGIQGEKIMESGTTLRWYDWSTHNSRVSSVFDNSIGVLANYLGKCTGYVAFYADCGTDVNDSFGNSTTQSSLASSINSLSDKAREMNFMIGNASGEVGASLDKLGIDGQNLAENIENMNSMISNVGLGEGNIFSSIISKARTLLAGGRLIFPEIWSDSSFGRSYSCKMKLVAVSGDKLSVYIGILAPIYHLLAMVMPRQSEGQAYYSPFLVRAYYKGLFNVDMGIITDLSVTKGAEGEWTLDGVPTVAEVSFSIKDLYDSMFMSDGQSNSLFSNIAELDYIATSCGINANDQEITRTARLAALLGANAIKDGLVNGIFGKACQYFNDRMNKIFGVF